MIYIGRGDCRTDEERGALVGAAVAAADPRPLERERRASAAATCTSGTRPQYNGAVNSGVTRAGVLAVYGDGGQGGERTNQANHKLEYGPARRHRRAGLHADRPHLPVLLPELQPVDLAAGPAGRAPDLEDRAGRGSRGSRSTSQTKRLILELGGADLRVRRPDLQLLPRRRRHGLRLRRATCTSRPATPTRRRARAATPATTSRRPARPGRRHEASSAHCGSHAYLLPGRAPDGGQHQRLQRQDAAVQAGRSDPGRHPAAGRRSARRTRSRAPARRTGRTCSAAPRAAAA